MVQGFFNKLGNAKNRLADALLGQQAPATDEIEMNDLLKGVDTSSPYYLESMGEEAPAVNITASANPRVGGIIPDMLSGYKDNYATGFAAPNWQNNTLPDGRNKGFAYRLGEGLGTVGRFVDSPLGRGLLAAGLNSALGYDNSLQEGLTAAVGRQNAQTADRLYRNNLKRDYGYTDEDLSNISGNIDGTTFNNLTKSQNSAMNLAIRQQATQSMNKLRELQAKKLEIQNSNLPEQEKAKTLKMLAEAEHAEQMQLAKIQYYTNSAALGWANYGLKADKAEKEAELDKIKQEILESLKGNGGSSSKPKGGTTKSGNKWKEVG